MNRRNFLSSAKFGALPLLVGCGERRQGVEQASEGEDLRFAGTSLSILRKRYQDELFESVLPFWDRYGVDREYGGILCFLDYDGTCADTNKFLWFQGRGIWVYSHLYHCFGQDSHYLEIAQAIKDFVFSHARQPDGWWPDLLSREGKILKPFSGDVYGMYFVAEGLQEYARAAGDEEALEMALALVKKLYALVERPDFQHPGTPRPGVRPQGLWMVNLRIATQILREQDDAEISSIADQCLEAIIEKHYNPEIGLNNELLDFDFGRVEGEARKSLFGHSIENLWMVMDEALRRNDETLWALCAERIRHHLEVGWDHVYGGLSHMVNVDAGAYVWPAERPVGTDYDFRFVGEYHYMKSMWALTEVLVATLKVFERSRVEWASRFFALAQEAIDTKFSSKKEGFPGYVLFGDRKVVRPEHVARQDNYHPPRQLMLNLQSLDRMLEGNR